MYLPVALQNAAMSSKPSASFSIGFPSANARLFRPLVAILTLCDNLNTKKVTHTAVLTILFEPNEFFSHYSITRSGINSTFPALCVWCVDYCEHFIEYLDI
jgi:hypothetical protein